MSPVPAHVPAVAAPPLHPLTLRFADEHLESEYQAYYRASVMSPTRAGLLLSILLYMVFAVTDMWTVPDRLAVVWPLRGAWALVLVVVLALSWRSWFVRHQQPLMFAVVLATTMNVALLYANMSGDMEYQHLIGLFLLMVGSFALIGLQFHYTAMVGAGAMLFWLTAEITAKDNAWFISLLNFLFLASTLAVVGLGARSADRERRLLYFSRLEIEHERQLNAHIALHDALTDLPNRRLLLERLARAMARSRRYDWYVAVLFMDLDGFKPVNDRHGHAFGDRLLCEIATRLQNAMRATDTVARLGGDEFVVLAEDLPSADDVATVIARIEDAFRAPCRIDNVALPVRMSIGVAMFPGDGETTDALLDRADRAMYEEKRRRGSRSTQDVQAFPSS